MAQLKQFQKCIVNSGGGVLGGREGGCIYRRRRRSMSLHEEGLHLNQSPSYLRPICTGYSPLTPPNLSPLIFPFFCSVLLQRAVWCRGFGGGGGRGGWRGVGSQLATYWLFQSLDPSVCSECITHSHNLPGFQVETRHEREGRDLGGWRVYRRARTKPANI